MHLVTQSLGFLNRLHKHGQVVKVGLSHWTPHIVAILHGCRMSVYCYTMLTRQLAVGVRDDRFVSNKDRISRSLTSSDSLMNGN